MPFGIGLNSATNFIWFSGVLITGGTIMLPSILSRPATICGLAVFVALVLAPAPARARQSVSPVSRILHVSAGATDGSGTANDSPPDLILTNEPGTFHLGAHAQTPAGSTGNASLDSGVNPSAPVGSSVLSIVWGLNGHRAVGQTTGGGVGSGSLTVVFDVPQLLNLSEQITAFGGNPNSANLTLKNSAGALLLNQTVNQMTNSSIPITLPPDRYMLTSSAFGQNSNSGVDAGISVAFGFNVVPEPGIAVVGLGLCAILSTRRSPRRPRARERAHQQDPSGR